jgi:hypothetical protein
VSALDLTTRIHQGLHPVFRPRNEFTSFSKVLRQGASRQLPWFARQTSSRLPWRSCQVPTPNTEECRQLRLFTPSHRFRFTSDSQNNDFGFIFYASATWAPHNLKFPHPLRIGGKIWDESAESALVLHFEKWEDAPRDEQARLFSMARAIALSLADTAVARSELRRDASMCAEWTVGVLVQTAVDSVLQAVAMAAAAQALKRARSEAAAILLATCRRARDFVAHKSKIVNMPSIPRGCRRLAVAVQVWLCVSLCFALIFLQESKLSFVFLLHVRLRMRL